MGGIINLHAKKTTNIGDLKSAISPYLRNKIRTYNLPVLNSSESLNAWIASEEFQDISSARAIIIGGGGLLARKSFSMALNEIFGLSGLVKKMILWGVGHNAPHLSEWRALKHPLNISQHRLLAVGVRDFGHGFDWVPCVSCMDPQFDKKFRVKHKICLYAHKDTFRREDFYVNLPKDIPTLSNDVDFKTAIRFLGEAELILTNSYHGAYWATLLKRRVVAFPNSSKFYDLRHAVPLCDPEDWERYAKLSKIYPNALEKCRAANIAFAGKVSQLTGSELSFRHG